AIAVLAVINRELVIPNYIDALSRNAQDWLSDSAKSLQPKYDNRTDILINGSSNYASEQRIESPLIRLPRNFEGIGSRVAGQKAFYQAPTKERPGGFLVDHVTEPASLAGVASVDLDGAPLLLMPDDHDWLEPHQCFLVSELTFDQLTA